MTDTAACIGLIETIQRVIALKARFASFEEDFAPQSGEATVERMIRADVLHQHEFELRDIVTELCALDREFGKMERM